MTYTAHTTEPLARRCAARGRSFAGRGDGRPGRVREGASGPLPPDEGIWLVDVYALVVLMVGAMAGWCLRAAGASPAEVFGGAVAAALLADHLLERP